MPRFARWWLWVALLAPAVADGQTTRRAGGGDDTPDAETLKRLAQQLQGDAPLPNDIDPELMKLAAEYLKKNPEVLNDPKFQEQMKRWQQQAKDDPNGLADQLKKQNLSPEQIDTLKKQFQQSNQNPLPPPPNVGKPPAVSRPPDGSGPRPNAGDPAPIQPQPWQLPKPTQTGPSQQFPQANTPLGPNGQPPSYDEQAQSKEGYQQAVAFWENNFGSIEQTPELKKSLLDMFSGEGKGSVNGTGSGGNPWGQNGNTTGGKPWWDNSGGGGNSNPSGFVQWLKNSTSNGPPSWWKSMTEWNKSGPPPNMSGGSGWTAPQTGGGGGFGDLNSGAWPVGITLGLLLLLVGGLIVWRYWPHIQAKLQNKPKALPGLGPWTIDPRGVTDRESLVKAFDYLSVLICGDGARVWNHQTIADSFRFNVPGAAPFAEPLARLYALARYSPANEPIDPADIAEARGYLCRLAEVPA